MKIALYVEGASGKGGIEVFAERQAARLRAEGHEVVVAGRPEEVPGDCAEIVVHKCGSLAVLEAFPPEKTVVYVHDHEPICPRTYAYDVWRRNCSRPGGVWPCLFCAPACRDWKGALRRVFAQGRRKRALARVKRIVVISEFMKGRLVSNGLPEGKIAVEKPEVRAKGTPKSVGVAVDLLYAGQLLRGKGVQVLLDAMARLDASRTLDVVGTGNMEGRLKAQAARLGLGERVRWHGFVEDARVWMAAAACVVVPSVWQEPYGLVAAEAVALGRRVVASDIGGLPEACGGKAVLVPPGDAAALARALENARPCP
ncbi:MAG: glycosyltransferase family 4 protein [Kiritimatiellae bacterium]|nr:glycosyltransferase family 4 protein [Kiritimatiellia bacterium]